MVMKTSASRWFKLGALVLLAWCVMTFTHELGHLLGGWASGGQLQHAELRPWKLPHSHFEPNPRPLITLWAGPLTLAAILKRPWAWFVANFCLLANGCYLATSWVSGEPFLDAPRLIKEGASPLSLVLYCLVTIGFGYWRFRANCVQVLSDSSVH
jgi:hypothetical protein